MAARVKPLPEPVAKVIEALPPDLRRSIRKGIFFPRVIIPLDDANRSVFAHNISKLSKDHVRTAFEIGQERLRQIHPDLENDEVFKHSEPIISYGRALEIYLKQIKGIKFRNRNIVVMEKRPTLRPNALVKELQIIFPRS